jgi:hypothetical protein
MRINESSAGIIGSSASETETTTKESAQPHVASIQTGIGRAKDQFVNSEMSNIARTTENGSSSLQAGQEKTNSSFALKAMQAPFISSNGPQQSSVNAGGTDKTSLSQVVASRSGSSDSSGLNVLTPGGGLTTLGGGSNSKQTAASASYAAEGSQTSSKSKGENYHAIRAEIAGALNVPENSAAVDEAYKNLAIQQKETAETTRVAENEKVIQDALINGRREEQIVKIGDLEVHRFTEYVPGASGAIEDFRVRIGSDVIKHGFFGDTIERTTRYFDGLNLVGQVTSEITNGVETITNVTEFKPGSIDLKPGQSRNLPKELTTAAGLAPSTLDPKADGSMGLSRPPYGAGASAGNGGSSSSNSSSSSSSSSSASPGTKEGMGPRTDSDATGVRGRTESSSQDHGSSEATGREWTKVNNDDVKFDGNHGESTTHTEEKTVEYKNQDGTYTYETTTITTKTEDGKAATETTKTTETTDKPKDGYVTDDGYNSTGPQLPAPKFGENKTLESNGSAHSQQLYSGKFGSFYGTLIHPETGNPKTVWGDYGNKNDPNAAPPPSKEDVHPPSVDPLIHVEPDADGGSGTLSLDQHEFQTSIHGGDYADPNDPLFGNKTMNDTPKNPNDSTPYENNS